MAWFAGPKLQRSACPVRYRAACVQDDQSANCQAGAVWDQGASCAEAAGQKCADPDNSADEYHEVQTEKKERRRLRRRIVLDPPQSITRMFAERGAASGQALEITIYFWTSHVFSKDRQEYRPGSREFG